jgi:CO/xanthine dehydrogenase FAD-binding subunit
LRDSLIPASFNYYAPSGIQDALMLLDKLGDNAKILAGGQSLVPMMKFRLASPESIIDINRVPGLAGIKRSADGSVEIGALTRYSELEASRMMRENFPVLVEATELVGDVHVRNRGTIGGCVCHADPSADVPTALLALDARLKSVSSKGERIIETEDFFLDTFTTRLGPNEILTGVIIPRLPDRSVAHFLKFSRRSADFAIVGVAVVLSFTDKMRCSRARIALQAVGPTVFRASQAEKALSESGSITDDVIEEASRKAAEESKPASDLLGSAEYKREMVKVVTKRAITSTRNRMTGQAS